MLIYALLIGPAAAAQTLTRGIGRGVLIAMVLGLMLTCAGLAAAYYIGYPASTWIASLSFILYVATQAKCTHPWV